MPGNAWPAAWVRSDAPWRGLRRVTRAAALAGIAAPAKLNLGLAVTGRRTDGYHNLVTLMVSLALADNVRVAPADDLTLVCDDPALATDDNLCLRAARALQEATGTAAGARIALTKRIPVAAGLGGGSADAAATLLALDALWRARTPDTALLRLATSLGADVPFALYGGAMLARGIGDLLTPATAPQASLVLVVPRVDIPRKTAALYAALGGGDYDTGAAVQQQAARLRCGAPPDPTLLGNSFLAPLERLAPAVAAARRQMAARGAPAALTGSGPTLYTLCDTQADAERLAAQLRGEIAGAVIVTALASCPLSTARRAS